MMALLTVMKVLLLCLIAMFLLFLILSVFEWWKARREERAAKPDPFDLMGWPGKTPTRLNHICGCIIVADPCPHSECPNRRA